MTRPPVFLHDFQSQPAKHHSGQGAILEWIAAAHAQAEITLQKPATDEEREAISRKYRKLVLRFGCSTDRISSRNAFLDDFTHTDWDRMRIFQLNEYPSGKPCGERSRFFREISGLAFDQFYPEAAEPPPVFIHVTCTGYVSPSGAQRLVAKRDWGRFTEVFHAYHMGCYASLPAIRMAAGFVERGKFQVDIVHTELCTLHLDPILSNYGNMSSATLPHVWKALLEDAAVPTGTLIVSMAFGPGLTISGALWMSTGAAALAGLPAPSRDLARGILLTQGLIVSGFLAFQIVYWASRKQPEENGPGINNALYDQLGERWYTATDDPVALLRAEARLRTSWVVSELRTHFGERPLAILDVGCGGGFLANPLAAAGHGVTGIDLSQDSLEVAQRHDPTGSVAYLAMDARLLALPDGHFDVVCMMDFLEHLSEREAAIREASRVLRPGGWFFFHTFNRTPLSGLIAIKGAEWFVKNTPGHMHVYSLFLKPSELKEICARHQLAIEMARGVRPLIFTRAFLKMLFTGRVSDQFRFTFTRSQSTGYCGRARKFA